ncbi:MAG: hypothetical protein JWO19_6063, partial [Bryobacterales bacterium]|nr:hypothetical protein [Bryobacterales bacterium]
VDVLPFDTSWLSEPTTGVHQFGGGSECQQGGCSTEASSELRPVFAGDLVPVDT